MRKIFASIGMAVCAVIGLPFKLIGFIFGLLAKLLGISNIIPLIAAVGTFILIMVITVQQAITGDSFVSTLLMGFTGASVVAGVIALFLNIWVIIAATLMKICIIMESAFGTVDNKLYQGYTFCKRYMTF